MDAGCYVRDIAFVCGSWITGTEYVVDVCLVGCIDKVQRIMYRKCSRKVEIIDER